VYRSSQNVSSQHRTPFPSPSFSSFTNISQTIPALANLPDAFLESRQNVNPDSRLDIAIEKDMEKSNISLTPEQKDQVRKLVGSFIGKRGDERRDRERETGRGETGRGVGLGVVVVACFALVDFAWIWEVVGKSGKGENRERFLRRIERELRKKREGMDEREGKKPLSRGMRLWSESWKHLDSQMRSRLINEALL
jgi:hypothetical protein